MRDSHSRRDSLQTLGSGLHHNGLRRNLVEEIQLANGRVDKIAAAEANVA